MTARTYLLQVISEPDEQPITLTQDVFDSIIFEGLTVLSTATGRPTTTTVDTLDGTVDELIDFAEITTSDGGPFLYRKHPLDQETADQLIQLGITSAIQLLLERYAETDEETP